MNLRVRALKWVVLSGFWAVGVCACEDQEGHERPDVSKVETSGAPSSPAGVFEVDGILGRHEIVKIMPMIETPDSVELRARSASVDKAALSPKAYGIRIFTLYSDAQVGTAFATHTSIYYLRSLPSKVIIDEIFFYCNGFLAENVLKISEKYRSAECGASDFEIARLLTQAEVVLNGTGCESVYREIQSGALGHLKAQAVSKEQPLLEESWLAGPQRIEGERVNLARSPHFGNEVLVEFLPSK